MQLQYKIFLTALFFTLIYIYSSFSYISHVKQRLSDEKYKEVVYNIGNEVKTLIEEKKEAILLLSLALSESDHIKNILLQKKDFHQINLQAFSHKLKKYSSLHNVWFQIVALDGTSVYRSWTSKSGDNVIEIRDDIAKVLQNPHVFSPISVGKFDMTFKSIVPIFVHKRCIGVVETIAKFNSISRKIDTLGWKNVLLVDKRYKKQLHVDKKMFLDGYYIANYTNVSKDTLAFIAQDLQSYKEAFPYKIKEKYLVTTYILKDINNKKMAYFILLKEKDSITFTEIKVQMKALVAIFVLIYMGIALFAYYIYVFYYKKFVQQQQSILEEKVASKTKELEAKSLKLKYQAEHDTLTQLPNRFLFLDRLKQALEEAYRNNTRVTVFFLDLDRFKEINDTYGHEVGDRLLELVTKRLLQYRRAEDTIARLGGDEFTLLLENVKQKDSIKIANQILQSMKKPFIINGVKHYTTFSIGISSYPEDGRTYEELLRNADTAMYKAKESGKNNYHFYNVAMTELAMERLKLEKELRSALKNGEFEAYFQPKIDAMHKKVVGLEALIRWKHPHKGMIFPDSFIPFAEEIGLIASIDNMMMKLSMQQVLQWHEKQIECGKISINLSARQLTSKNYINELETAVREIGLDPRYIEIEITETHIMENPEYAMEILHKIRALGISISIDDFGTGYSSLSYLKKLPVTKLKIDRSFVVELPYDKDDVAIVKTIISLAKNLGLELIAEGVERKEQVDFLVQEGCYDIQGYYFSKPLSKEDCEKFLKTFE